MTVVPVRHRSRRPWAVRGVTGADCRPFVCSMSTDVVPRFDTGNSTELPAGLMASGSVSPWSALSSGGLSMSMMVAVVRLGAGPRSRPAAWCVTAYATLLEEGGCTTRHVARAGAGGCSSRAAGRSSGPHRRQHPPVLDALDRGPGLHQREPSPAAQSPSRTDHGRWSRSYNDTIWLILNGEALLRSVWSCLRHPHHDHRMISLSTLTPR